MTINIINKEYQSHGMNFGKKMQIKFEDVYCDQCGKVCRVVYNMSNDSSTAGKAYYAKCFECDREYWF